MNKIGGDVGELISVDLILSLKTVNVGVVFERSTSQKKIWKLDIKWELDPISRLSQVGANNTLPSAERLLRQYKGSVHHLPSLKSEAWRKIAIQNGFC